MNPTLETIARRRSVRAYADRALTQEEKDAILNAAMRAPTAGNMMLYAILEIEDQQLKERLSETCDHQPFIARAPYVLIFLADYQRWYDVYVQAGVEVRCAELDREFRKPQEGDLMLACADAIIAAQNAVVAAESMGIGSCYIGDIMENYEIHRELLGLEPYTFPAAMLCFGYPADPNSSVPQVNAF
jgi:nitroreductase